LNRKSPARDEKKSLRQCCARIDGVEPAGVQAIVLTKKHQEAIMTDHWPISIERVGAIQDTSEDTAAYAAGWTVSGLATLATILVVWMFAI
jgi:hypothetical protein